MNPQYLRECGDEDGGTDLNRNWGVDWSGLSEYNPADKCGEYWPGSTSFSEPETKAVRDFIESNKQSLKFIINFHSWGQAFIWPYNAKQPNDIQGRSPGYLDMFRSLASNGLFPTSTQFGNSGEVMGQRIHGDADDYVMSSYGIPSVTAELGKQDSYINDWLCKGQFECYQVLNDNNQWVNYLLQNIETIAKTVQPK